MNVDATGHVQVRIVEATSSPRKKARTHRQNAMNKQAFYLNQTGIVHFGDGRDKEAEMCFSQALDCLDWEDSAFTISSCPTFGIRKEASTKAEMGQTLIADETRGHRPSLKIRQHQKFDEGMHMYSHVLPLPLTESDESAVHTSLVSATLLYNIGQTYARRCQFGPALQWFKRALAHFRIAHGSSPSRSFVFSSERQVRALHNLGHCYYRLGMNGEAMQCYRAALVGAEGAQLDDLHPSINRCAMAVLLFYEGKETSHTKALELFQNSLQVYSSHFGRKSKEVATVLNNMGRVYFGLGNGQYGNALSMYKQSLSIRRQVLGEGSIDLTATISNTGQAHQQCGELDQAMTYYQEFVTLTEKHLPSDEHQHMVIIYQYMADIHLRRRELQDAKMLLERALHVGRSTFGPIHPEVAIALTRLGNLHFELRDFGNAIKFFTECLHVGRVIFDSCHPQIVVSLLNIAEVYRAGRHHVEALKKYKEVYAIQMTYLGPNSLDVARTLSSIGLSYHQLKHYGLAFESYQEALRIYRDTYGTDDREEIASLLNSIGLVLFHRRNYHDMARGCFTDSLRIRQKIVGPNHKTVAMLWYNIGTIYLETGQGDVAIAMYKETLRIERKALGEKHDDVIVTLQHLGLVHQQRGELEEAMGYFGEALKIERTKVARNSRIAVAKLQNLIGNIHLQRANVGPMMECFAEASRIYRDYPHVNEAVVIAGYNLYGLSGLHPPCAPIA